MTFVYNRDSSTEHYSEIPTNDELVRLSKDLDIIKYDYHHGKSVNLTGAAKIAKEMLDEYIEYLMDKE
jgi:hypothetical protein